MMPALVGSAARQPMLDSEAGRRSPMTRADRGGFGLAVLLVLGLVALLFPLPDWARQAGYIAGGLFFAIAVVSLVALAHEDGALRLLGTLLRPLPNQLGVRVQAKAASFVAGLRVLQSGPDLLAVAGWSVVIWSVELTTQGAFQTRRCLRPRDREPG